MNLVEFRDYEGNNFIPLPIYNTEKPIAKLRSVKKEKIFLEKFCPKNNY